MRDLLLTEASGRLPGLADLVTSEISRTEKFLAALAVVPAIVNEEWVADSIAAGRLLGSFFLFSVSLPSVCSQPPFLFFSACRPRTPLPPLRSRKREKAQHVAREGPSSRRQQQEEGGSPCGKDLLGHQERRDELRGAQKAGREWGWGGESRFNSTCSSSEADFAIPCELQLLKTNAKASIILENPDTKFFISCAKDKAIWKPVSSRRRVEPPLVSLFCPLPTLRLSAVSLSACRERSDRLRPRACTHGSDPAAGELPLQGRRVSSQR